MNHMTVRLRRLFTSAPRLIRTLSTRADKTIDSEGPEKRDITLEKSSCGEYFTLLLQHRPVKTPMKNDLKIKNEILALAILDEWKHKAIKGRKLDVPRMHLTSLACEAIDNPLEEDDKAVVDSIMQYLYFDTTRFRATEDQDLLHKQSRHWDPIIGWFEQQYGCYLPIVYDDITNTTPVPKATIDIIRGNLETKARWPLVGLRYIAQNLKSMVLASSLTEKFLSVEQAVDLARLETNHQVDMWSKVEWEHDLDEHSVRACASAGSLLYHLSLP